MVADATTTNFVGMRMGNTTVNFTRGTDAGGKVRYVSASNATLTPAKRVGTTITLGGGIGLPPNIGGDLTMCQMLMAEIVKGSPNYLIRQFFINSTMYHMSQATFLDLIAASTPSSTGYTWNSSTNISLACDESTGTFDTVNFYWDHASPVLEISDLAIARMA
jgi:hypothetical protein